MSILLALSSNVDNLGVGISYGARKITIPFASNILIAILTSFGTLLSLLVGNYIHSILKPQAALYLGSFAIIGGGLLIVIADTSKRLRKKINEMPSYEKKEFTEYSFLKKILIIHNNPLKADMDYSADISLKESFFLGSALTLNNIANGVGAGMINLSPLVTTSFVFLFSIITMSLGTKIGDIYMYRQLGTLSGPASGILLICVGIFNLCA